MPLNYYILLLAKKQNYRIIFSDTPSWCIKLWRLTFLQTWISHVGNWQKLVHRVKYCSVLEKITFQQYCKQNEKHPQSFRLMHVCIHNHSCLHTHICYIHTCTRNSQTSLFPCGISTFPEIWNFYISRMSGNMETPEIWKSRKLQISSWDRSWSGCILELL